MIAVMQNVQSIHKREHSRERQRYLVQTSRIFRFCIVEYTRRQTRLNSFDSRRIREARSHSA